MTRLGVWRLAGLAVLTAAYAGGLALTEHRFDQSLAAIEQAARVDEARRCVGPWTTREDIRDAAERAGRAGGEAGANASALALIDVAGADPELVATYQSRLDVRLDEQLQPALAAARAEIPDPTCDRATAQRVIDQQE